MSSYERASPRFGGEVAPTSHLEGNAVAKRIDRVGVGLAIVRRHVAVRMLTAATGMLLLVGARRRGSWHAVAMAGIGGLLIGHALPRTRVLREHRRARAREVDRVAAAGEESFPASDAPSWSPTSVGQPAHDR